MKYGKEVRKRLDPLMEKHGYKLEEEDSLWVFYVNREKTYLQTLSFLVEWHDQYVCSRISYNRLINNLEYCVDDEHYTSKEDLLYKLDNEWLPRIEAALNKQWIKPGIDFLDGSIDEDIYNNYQTYAKEVLSSKDYPFNNIKDVRYIINDLLSQNLSYKDFMKKASSVYIKYVLEADNEFKELELGEYLGFRYNIYIKNGIKWPYKTIRVLGVIISFWHFGDRDSLEFGRGFYGINDDGDVVDTRQSEGIIERINNGEIVKLIY